jgi:UDPglucose 6-dehydrogenase
MKITVVGTGYVGLVAGACLAEFGLNICCLDKDAGKIALLNSGKIHIHEPGLQELVQHNLSAGRLKFSTDSSNLDWADVLIIAVGTPQSDDGSADLSFLNGAISDIATHAKTDKTIMIKSTVPLGTAKMVSDKLKLLAPMLNFDIISNPEFLREGSAVRDFLEPDRVVIGYNTSKAKEVAANIYKPLSSKGIPITYTKNTTAELIKYAANSYLAMRIAFINEIADICEEVDADIEEVADGIGQDKRIGRHYLRAGPGYGGSCFPKDTLALNYAAEKIGTPSKLVQATILSNELRKEKMADKILNNLKSGNTVAIMGLTFKADTDDLRDSPSIPIIKTLIEKGCKIIAYDPCIKILCEPFIHENITLATSIEEAVEKADIVAFVTEWNEFQLLDPKIFINNMKNPLVVDYRNIFDPFIMKNLGVKYISVGRKNA